MGHEGEEATYAHAGKSCGGGARSIRRGLLRRPGMNQLPARTSPSSCPTGGEGVYCALFLLFVSLVRKSGVRPRTRSRTPLSTSPQPSGPDLHPPSLPSPGVPPRNGQRPTGRCIMSSRFRSGSRSVQAPLRPPKSSTTASKPLRRAVPRPSAHACHPC